MSRKIALSYPELCLGASLLEAYQFAKNEGADGLHLQIPSKDWTLTDLERLPQGAVISVEVTPKGYQEAVSWVQSVLASRSAMARIVRAMIPHAGFANVLPDVRADLLQILQRHRPVAVGLRDGDPCLLVGSSLEPLITSQQFYLLYEGYLAVDIALLRNGNIRALSAALREQDPFITRPLGDTSADYSASAAPSAGSWENFLRRLVTLGKLRLVFFNVLEEAPNELPLFRSPRTRDESPLMVLLRVLRGVPCPLVIKPSAGVTTTSVFGIIRAIRDALVATDRLVAIPAELQ